MTTEVPGPRVPRSPWTTRDIPGCPTRHPGMSYIPDMTTKVPGPKVPRSPGTTKRNDLARPVLGTIFLIYIDIYRHQPDHIILLACARG